MQPDTLLAYALNGETLPKDHGFPLRALVPGWVGSANIKWLGRIVVSSEQKWTRNNTTHYALIGDEYPPEGESLGKPATTQVIKSALVLPWPAELFGGAPPHPRLRPLAPGTGLTRGVEHRLRAHLDRRGAVGSAAGPVLGAVRVRLGRGAGRARRDDARHRQPWATRKPDRVPFNERGYLFNQPLPHPIRVA